jgi:hypothetical protein
MTAVPPKTPAPAKPPKPAKPPRKRLTVPVLLLIVGVTLVGVAAIFFLVLAWTSANIGVKSLIIGGVTLATMVAASVLRRFRLKATAEGIAVLGVILLALDAWAVRLNDLFGAGAMKPALYAGIAALVVGALCRAWSVISRLRGPDLAATLALPAGLGLLVAGLVPLDTTGAIAAGFLGTAVGGLAFALPAPWSAARVRADSVPERTGLAVIGALSLLGGAVMLGVGLESFVVQLVMAIVVITLGVAYGLLLRPREDVGALPLSVAIAATGGTIAAAATASLGWQLAAVSDLSVWSQLIAPVVAVGVAVGLDRWRRRGVTATAARVAAASVAAASTLIVLLAGLVRASQATGGWTLWTTDPFSAPVSSDAPASIMAVIAAAIIAVLLFFAPSADRPVLRQLLPIVGETLLLTAAFGTGIPFLIFAIATATAVVALIGLSRKGMRVGWGIVVAAGTATAFLVGVTLPWLWAIGVIIAVAVPIAARAILPADIRSDILLALAPVAVGAIAAVVAPWAISAAVGVPVDERAMFVLLQWMALITLAAAVVVRIDAPSGSALGAAGYVLIASSLLAFAVTPASSPSVSTQLGEPAMAIVRTGLLLVLVALIALRRTRLHSWVSLSAALLFAPVAAATGVAVLDSAGLNEPGVTAITVTAVAVVTVWLGALLPPWAFGAPHEALTTRSTDAEAPGEAEATPSAAEVARTGYRAYARIAFDAGALVTVISVVPFLPLDARWVVLALLALLFAGTAVTRGWAAPAGERMAGIPQIRADGVPIAQAPRRLLAWPALAAATAALWVWLDGTGGFEVEAYVVPPAVALLLFTGVLVWLRREAEATIAITVSFALGLVMPALVGLDVGSVRGTVVAVVAAAVAMVLAWTPARRVRFPALAGALVALVAVGVVALARAVGTPATPAWLVLLVGAAYACAYGFIRGPRVPADPAGAERSAEVTFAAIVPPVALGIASVALVRSLDQPLTVTIALVLLGALHLVSAAMRTNPLGTATRWTALGGAVLTASGAYLAQHFGAVEIMSMPLAIMVLGGAALAMWRRARHGEPWPGSERIVWLVGMGVAIAPSVAAEPNDVRTWLIIAGALLAAVECIVVPLPESLGLKTPSALILSAGALAMGARALLDPAVSSGELAAIVAGAGALLIAAAMIWQREADDVPAHTTVLAAAGAALAVLAVVVHADGDLMRAALTAVIAGVLGLGGALLLRFPRWAALGGVLAVAGLVAALIGVGSRFALVAGTAPSGLEPDVWAVAGVGIVVAIGIAALRSTESRVVAHVVSATFSVALVLFAGAEIVLLGTTDVDQLRTIVTVTALTAVGVIGFIRRERLGLPLPITAAALTVVFGLSALLAFGVRPFELVTVPPAVGLIVLGARTLQRDPNTRTWPTLGPGLALLTIPSLVYDFTVPSLVDEFASLDEDAAIALWRAVGLGVLAIAMVVGGAIWRLQAPLVLGSAVLLVHAVAQLWPWISDLYAVVPWWLWLGIGGAVLIFLAARYEKRMRELRTAFTAVASLR